MLGLTGAAISITKSVISLVVATDHDHVPDLLHAARGAGVDRAVSTACCPSESQPRWRRVGHDIYRTVGGYVTGNLLISLIAGTLTTVVLLALGVPFAVALGLIVAILDLIPLAGATIAAIIIGTVAFLHSITAGIVVVVFFIVYQQIENHFLQPVVYGRTVQLSPLAVLDLGADRRGARRDPRRARSDPGRRRDPGDPDRLAAQHRRARAAPAPDALPQEPPAV